MRAQTITILSILFYSCTSANKLPQDYIDGYAHGCHACRNGEETLEEQHGSDYISGYYDACYKCSTREQIHFKDEKERENWENTWEKVKK